MFVSQDQKCAAEVEPNGIRINHDPISELHVTEADLVGWTPSILQRCDGGQRHGRMSLKSIDLTTALRPTLLSDEVLLFVQDNVGLYEGKFKIPDFQNGHVYLTSHRICYVDNELPRKRSAGIDLKDVERYEFYAGFLKSSPKITLALKPPKRSSFQTRPVSGLPSPSRSATASPALRNDSPFRLPPADPTPAQNATWICPICTFSNPIPTNFDPQRISERTPLPPCLTCGVPPPLTHILKAIVSNAAHRPAQQSSISVPPSPLRSTFDSQRRQSEVISDSDYESAQFGGSQDPQFAGDLEGKFQCPRCTYANDPAMLSCEICEAPLISHDIPAELERATVRTESPGPTLQGLAVPGVGAPESIKISFRGGGEKIFHERLKGAMTQRKWLLQWAPPVPKPNELGASSSSSASPTANGTKTVGIAGLEARRNEIRKNNEIVIGSAFEDLETLMASAKEIIALAERFARQTNGSSSEASALIAQSASELGLVTKDMLGSGSNSESLYLSELSRNVAEFLTDDSKGVLRKAGGIISLVDLWAIFNRARGGVELVSPNDFEKAARLWEKLRLPVRLRQFKSGVLVVQASDRTDEKTIKALLAWLQTMHYIPPEKEVPWDWQAFGCGVTAQDAASHFGWSIGVATEELEMAEEKGVLCREESIEGLKFWENFIGTAATTTAAVDPILENLQLLGIG